MSASPEPDRPSSPTSGTDVLADLKSLADLYRAGLLSLKEFGAAKRQLLADAPPQAAAKLSPERPAAAAHPVTQGMLSHRTSPIGEAQPLADDVSPWAGVRSL